MDRNYFYWTLIGGPLGLDDRHCSSFIEEPVTEKQLAFPLEFLAVIMAGETRTLRVWAIYDILDQPVWLDDDQGQASFKEIIFTPPSDAIYPELEREYN